MIDFYTFGTFNGQAVAIALEEMSLDYRLIKVDLMKSEQRSPAFLKLNPSGRIPVIVDHVSEHPTVISQSTAILIYLAEKSGLYLPNELSEKAKVLEWLMFQATDISTNIFNNFYLKSLVDIKQPEAGNMLKKRAINFYKVFDKQLKNNRFIVNNSYSVADIAVYPVVHSLIDNEVISEMKYLCKWYQVMSQRPAVISGMKYASGSKN